VDRLSHGQVSGLLPAYPKEVIMMVLDNYAEFDDVIESELSYHLTLEGMLRAQAKYLLLTKQRYYYEEFL